MHYKIAVSLHQLVVVVAQRGIEWPCDSHGEDLEYESLGQFGEEHHAHYMLRVDQFSELP